MVSFLLIGRSIGEVSSLSSRFEFTGIGRLGLNGLTLAAQSYWQTLRGESGSRVGTDLLSCLDLSVKKLQNTLALLDLLTTKPSIRGLVFHLETV